MHVVSVKKATKDIGTAPVLLAVAALVIVGLALGGWAVMVSLGIVGAAVGYWPSVGIFALLRLIILPSFGGGSK